LFRRRIEPILVGFAYALLCHITVF
jgi:hypothetical protein